MLAAIGALLTIALASSPAQAAPGEYVISGLPTGSYTVEFSAGFEGGNYLRQYFSGQPTVASSNKVAVTAPSVTPGINATLQPGGQISGVVSSGGVGLAGVQVCANSTAPEGSNGCTASGPGGTYTVSGLSSGSYSVTFAPFESGNLLSATDSGVAVTAPGTTTGINAALAVGGQISGRVTAEVGGAPIANVQICAEGSSFGACAASNANGEYTISGLAGGEYSVSFSTFEVGNFLSRDFPGSVNVTAGLTTPGVNAQLATGGQIGGRVTAEVGGAPIAGIEVCSLGTTFACSTSNSFGEYTISGLESGEYSVDFSSSFGGGGNYLPASKSGVTVTAPNETANVNAALAPGGQISGFVAGAGGTRLAAVTICAASTTSDNCATSNGAGEYTIPGLASGGYTVSFVAPFESNYLTSSDSGVPVTAPNTTAGINAELQPGGQIAGTVALASGTLAGKVEVCAFSTTGGGNCALATPAPFVAPPPPPPPVVPNSTFAQSKHAIFNKKTGNLEFFFTVANAGKFRWGLTFKNADVAFADDLGLSLGAAGEEALAQSAKKKSKRCKKGFIKHKGKCVRLTVPFGSGTKSVGAGTIQINVKASAKALKALRAGHTLHISGPFVFQSALGGAPVTHTESVVVRLPKPHKKKKKKH